MKPVLVIDANATEHIFHRHGIGRMKHVDVAHLWLQDDVKSERLRVRRVKSGDNLADMGAKAVSSRIIRKHATGMGVCRCPRELEVRRSYGFVDR